MDEYKSCFSHQLSLTVKGVKYSCFNAFEVSSSVSALFFGDMYGYYKTFVVLTYVLFSLGISFVLKLNNFGEYGSVLNCFTVY